MKRILLLVSFGSVSMAVAAIGVTRYRWPVSITYTGVIVLFSLLSYLLFWHGAGRRVAVARGNENKTKGGLKLLFIPFVLGAISALFLALKEGWNVGDTIGACVFVVFAVLVVSELIRRKGNAHSE